MDYGYLRELFLSCLTADYRHVENAGSFALVRDGELLYIFFEKSNGAEDWINNLSYHAVSVRGEQDGWFCHEGFLRVWNSVLPYLENLISSATVRRIITVGYSHGAALALLCHEYIWFTRSDIRTVCEGYGFGCPRAVWGTVPEEQERWKRFFLVRNSGDLVTHLPPRISGYRHVGNLIEIGEREKYTGVDAHRAENYLTELENMQKRTQRT